MIIGGRCCKVQLQVFTHRSDFLIDLQVYLSNYRCLVVRQTHISYSVFGVVNGMSDLRFTPDL